MTHCNIHFRVKFFTNYSETVSVLGNVEPLGGWNTQLAFPLKTNQSLYPYWESENPIQVPSGTKLEFKFAIMKDGQLHRWENLPLGENRTYRSRYYQVTLEFSEAVPQFSEDVNKRFVSSASLENLDEFKRVKKGKKVFNPFITAQDSLSSDSWEGSSADKCSSDDLNSFGNNDASPLKEGIEDSQFDKDPEMSIEPNMSESRANKLNTLANKTADLQAIIKSGNHEPEVLSLLYHHYKTQNNLPKNKPTCILNHESEDEGSSPDLEDEEAEFSSHDQVFYVSFKLPINIRQLDPNATEINKRWEIKVNMNTHLGSVYRLCKQQTKAVFWIGWIGVFIDQNEQEALSKHLYKEYNCVPIFLEEETCSKFLYEYCNQFLHDAFFNILDMKAVFSQETYVESYNDVNKLYTEKILEYANLQSLILIQDYHLMMIPKYLCQSNPKYTLGYIFETPFPTLEVFKVFYNKKELLESLLCCDLICFNTSEYIKMFTNISAKLMNIYLACERGGHMHLKNGGRKVYVRVAFPSVDPSYISDVLSKQPYIDIKASVQEKYASKTLIVGIAHFTKIEGIESLIQSIKSLFESEKDQNYHFCLLNFDDVYKHDQDNAEKKAFFIKIQNEINSINNSMKQMGLKNEMEVIGGIISEENKLALMSVSKLLIAFSPYLDNDLHILEYLFSKVSNHPGSIILSEFSHGHKHLNSLIKVNPFNKIEIMEGIRKGLTRNPETASYLMELDRGLVTNYTSWHRLQGLLNDVKKAQQIKSRLNLLRVDESNEFKLIVVNEAFQSLDQQKLLQNFKVSKRRVIILGYEETLSTGTASTRKQLFSEGNLTLGTGISSDDMDIIRALTLISDISLYIISSKKVDVLAKEFESVPNANLIAENGFSYRIARQSKWFNIFHCDWSWKSIVQRIMQNYANRTEGVKVEVKESSLTWDHSDVRTEIAKIQELELINHLSTVLTHVKNLEVVKERRCVEVKPAGISKGLISELILEKCRIMEGQYPDFILCLGATSKDEAMFEKMEQIASENEDFERINLFTCIPKKKPSNARYYLQGIPETFSMLRMLAENC